MKRLLFAVAGVAFGQTPSGLDIDTAIPITFGQAVDDIMDTGSKPRQVYKISVGRGQQMSANLTLPPNRPGASIGIYFFAPNTRSIANLNCQVGRNGSMEFADGNPSRSESIDLTIANGGDYFVAVCTRSNGVQYRLQVNAEGTPIVSPLPAQAGCVFGQVDFIEFSLRLAAMGLPDRLSIGGQEICAACTAKPPLYEPLVREIKDAMRMGVNVEACHDDRGNIFKVKLQR